MPRVFCKKWWKLNIFPYLIDFLPFLIQVLSLYVYAILLKKFRHSMVLGESNTKDSEKYGRAPVKHTNVNPTQMLPYQLSIRGIDINRVLSKIHFIQNSNGNLLSFFCLDVAQGHMKGAPNETRTHSCRFASRAC